MVGGGGLYHKNWQVIAALRGRLFAWAEGVGRLECAPNGWIDKGQETKPASGGAMPRRSLRNIALLAICQALTQSSNTLMFASSALAVLTIVSPDMRMWANLPVTMQHLGVMLSVFPASLLMMRRGRKFGFASAR